MYDNVSHLKKYLEEEDLCGEDLKKYVKLYQETGCPKAYETVINGCMNFMMKMSCVYKRYYTHYNETELLSCVFKGVGKAIEKYDENKGASFTTYAVFWIRYYIAAENLTYNSKVKISQSTHTNVKKLSGLMESESDFSNKDLSDAMNIPEKKVIELKSIKECMRTYSVSSPGFINNQMELALFENNKLGYDPIIINACINELDDRTYTIITERFGIIDGNRKTLKEIGSIVGLSIERVRQIIKNTLPILKEIYVDKMKDN